MCAGRWWLKDGSPHELLLRVRIRKETGGPVTGRAVSKSPHGLARETVRIKPGTVHAGYVHPPSWLLFAPGELQARNITCPPCSHAGILEWRGAAFESTSR